MKRTVFGIMLLQFLIAACTLTFNIQSVEAGGTIYIRADGSVDPRTAPISSADNVTYTFTDNIYDGIVIERGNIVLDGAGYAVEGSFMGILLLKDGVTIKNMEIESHGYGIDLASSGNMISRNNIANNWYGIYLAGSGNIVSGNNITSNLYGIYMLRGSNNTVSGNNITGNWYAIAAVLSFSNCIYHNNFIKNKEQAFMIGLCNTWDNGYPSGGNYWGDYFGVDLYSGPFQNETGSDGVGDTPYFFAGVHDNYPLMNPYFPLFGDLNDDRKVDIGDVAVAALAFGSFPGHPRWNFIADVNQDDKVDLRDIALIVRNFGKT